MATESQQARRLTILETRFDTILPTLATKTNLAELKAELKTEIRAESARLSRWMATIAVTMFIGFGGMFVTMLSLLPR
jgi:hypothetical protein